MRGLKHKVHNSIKLEKLAWLDSQADRVVSSFSSGDSKDLFSCIKEVLGVAGSRKKDPKFLRVGSGGVPSQSVVQEKLAFRDHFSRLMQGDVCSFASLVQADRNSSACRFDNIISDSVPYSMPLLFDLVCYNSSLKKGKACGEGRLVSDVFRCFPALMARLFSPLLSRLSLAFSLRCSGRGG